MLKKSIFIVVILIFLVAVSLNVFAATKQPWGPHYYTPDDAQVGAYDSVVFGINMKWYSAGINHFYDEDYWELEFRPNSGQPNYVWDGVDSYSSNLPGSYYEWEPTGDDITVGCKWPTDIVANKNYYGTLWMDEKSSPSNPSFTIESEVGTWFLWDGLPDFYEVFKTNASKNVTYSW